MDEFFDKIKGGATKAMGGAERIAKKVADRTTRAITHTKLVFAVNEAQDKVKDVYRQIGKELYAKHLDGADCGEDFADSFDQLDKLMDEISMLNDKIAELKNSLKCAECGAFNSNESEYCSKCGAKIVIKNNADNEDDEVIIDEIFDEAEADDDDEVITINPKKPE